MNIRKVPAPSGRAFSSIHVQPQSNTPSVFRPSISLISPIPSTSPITSAPSLVGRGPSQANQASQASQPSQRSLTAYSEMGRELDARRTRLAPFFSTPSTPSKQVRSRLFSATRVSSILAAYGMFSMLACSSDSKGSNSSYTEPDANLSREAGPGDSTSSSSSSSLTVTFDLNAKDATWAGQKPVKTLSVSTGDYIQKQATRPTRANFMFTGWYTETDTAKQSEATRFRFEGEPNAQGATLKTVKNDMTLYAGWGPKTLEGVAKLGEIPSDITGFDDLAQTVLRVYSSEAGAAVSTIYVTPNGGQTSGTSKNAKDAKDGRSWATAWDGSQLVDKYNEIGADQTHITLFLVAVGTYNPPKELIMKDYVAIVGGWDGSGGWTRATSATPPTVWDGGHTPGSGVKSTNGHRLIHNSGVSEKAFIAWVDLQKGYAADRGGCVYNEGSLAVFTHMTISTCEATAGGGMYNNNSSPTMSDMTFSGNYADEGTVAGGGMYNAEGSGPIMSRMTFAQNKAKGNGGAMVNHTSSPLMSQITFYKNESGRHGGAMHNFNSPVVVVNATFYENKVIGGQQEAGGLLIHQSDRSTIGSTFVNCIFWGNRAFESDATNSKVSSTSQIDFFNPGSGDTATLNLYNTIVEGGITNTAGTAGTLNNKDFGVGIKGCGNGYFSCRNSMPPGIITVNYSNVTSANTSPLSNAQLADNGGFVKTLAIESKSPAKDQGVYAGRSGRETFYSLDNKMWYKPLPVSGQGSTLPAGAIDLTATDARGYARVGKPDLGAYEYGATQPTP